MWWVTVYPWVMADRFLLFASLLAFACSGHPDTPLASETSPAASCGPDGYILPEALPGDLLSASSPLISSVVVSSGLLDWTVTGTAWVATVAELHGPGPLVVAFRRPA
jgi:hypothetical protein